VGGGGKEGG